MPTPKTSKGTHGSSRYSSSSSWSSSSPEEEKGRLLKDSSSRDSSRLSSSPEEEKEKVLLLKDSSSADSSSSGEVEDASIYFRILTKRNTTLEYDWYVIKGNLRTPENQLLSPILPKPPKLQWSSGCGVVGSTIYVLGGVDIEHARRTGNFSRPPVYRDVYYIDARRPGGGWKKSCHSMNKGRARPYVVSNVDFDGKTMYVFGADHESDAMPGTAEVFEDDDHDRKGGWRVLGPLPPALADVPITGGHAVLDAADGKKSRILFHSRSDPSLYAYDTESDSWELYSDSSLGLAHYTSAVVDGILYTLNFTHPGILYAMDVSNPENCSLKQVLLDDYFIPTCPTEEDVAPHGFLVSIGNSKLAVVWASLYTCPDGRIDREKLYILCSKLRMSKRYNAVTGEVDFVADCLSFSVYCVKGSSLRNCVAIFPSQKSVTKEDVNKEDNKTVTNNSCNNSSNKEKKKMKKKNKNKDKKQIEEEEEEQGQEANLIWDCWACESKGWV